MKAVRDKTQAIIQKAVERAGFEYVGCQVIHYQRGTALRIYIDKSSGVLIDECAEVSRQIQAALDVESEVRESFSLEVSSPGLDRPLFKLADYQRFLGKVVKIRMRHLLESRRNFTGILKQVNEDDVTVLMDNQEIVLPFSDIDKANLVPEFPE